MELRLKQVTHDYYETVTTPAVSCETMRETIVPDNCADIARIIETRGFVCLTGREMSADGRMSISGAVEVSVLYIPEKGVGPCSLRFQLPFQSYSDGNGEYWEYPDVRGVLRRIDTRLLNPRKVLTRADVMLYPTGCRHVVRPLAVEQMEDAGLQLQTESRTVRVVAGIREKEFHFAEEIALSQGKGGAEELLWVAAEMRSTDAKLIGNKLVVKGLVSASLLYRETGGGVSAARQELPFSQILEGSGFGEQWELEPTFQLLSSQCSIGSESNPDDPHLLTMQVSMRTRVVGWRQEEMDFLTDLYSTECAVTCRTDEMVLREEEQKMMLRGNARELLETGSGAKSVVDADVSFWGSSISGDELELSMTQRCLYWDENDTLHSVSKEGNISIKTELPAGWELQVRQVTHGDVMPSILPDGIELRFPVEGTAVKSQMVRHLCICGGDTVRQEEDEKRPSLVLRKLGRGETLWTVAKQYRTTCQAIRDANGLTEEAAIPTDHLLLIPRA